MHISGWHNDPPLCLLNLKSRPTDRLQGDPDCQQQGTRLAYLMEPLSYSDGSNRRHLKQQTHHKVSNST